MIFEIEDEDEANTKSNDLHYMTLIDFGIPNTYSESMAVMAINGLLLLYSELGPSQIPIIICNPITREYIELFCPEEYISINFTTRFGFGASKLSGQYKVVSINADAGSDFHHVYTLGTRTWRRVEAGAASGFQFNFGGRIVCNGNLHWTVNDSTIPFLIQPSFRICGFDVETKCFSIFSPPPAMVGVRELSVLRDCLCFSYFTWGGDEIVIWLMKEYQVEESWTIEYRLSTVYIDRNKFPFFHPIKAFKNGDILMLLDETTLIYYSNKIRTIQPVNMGKDAVGEHYFTYAMIYTPIFISLESFGFENVISFSFIILIYIFVFLCYTSCVRV